MVVDIGVVTAIAAFAVIGYSRGLLQGLESLVTPVAGIWFALRRCDDLAAHLVPAIGDLLYARIIALVLIWLGLILVCQFARRLLVKLVDWSRCCDLEQYLGGLLGLARGMAFVWFVLAVTLTAFPPSVRLVERSRASVRLLALGERLSGSLVRTVRDPHPAVAFASGRPGYLPGRAGPR